MSHPPPSPHPVEEFDELDPHHYGAHGQHASHVIVGPFTLRTVLAILLFFTALTVATAQLEVWIMGHFGITLPLWINVAGAMTIATIKTLLVMAYFMQLRYDNPMNSVAMAFCFAALCIFVGFTALDLFGRPLVYDFKAGPIVAGGTGDGVRQTQNKPAVTAARERYIAKLQERLGSPEAALAEYGRLAAEAHAAHGGGHAHAAAEANTENRSRPRTGLSGALAEKEHDGHEGGHDTHTPAHQGVAPEH